MIEARGLTKFYGERAAVSNLSFTVRPGVVTGFLGPNGAGKSMVTVLVTFVGGQALLGRALFVMNGGDGMLSPWLGFAVFVLYTVVVLAAAALVLRQRDA